MATIGVDCQVILDGVGYYVEPQGYTMKRPRIRRATIVKGGQERYVDLGPGKREWHLVLLCLNQLVDYSGAPATANGEALRNGLAASYARLATLAYTDLDGQPYSVHFDHYEEQVRDPRTQLVAPGYHVAVVLVEA